MASFELKTITQSTVTTVTNVETSSSSDHHYTPLSCSDHSDHYLTPLPSRGRSDQYPVSAAPGRSTTSSPRNLQQPSTSSITPADLAEPVYDTAEPPPSPTETSREPVLPVRASRSRVRCTTLRYFLWLTGLFTVAVLVGSLLYIYVPHRVSGKSVCKILKQVNGDNEAKLMTKLAPEWVRTNDPVFRSPARYRWTTAPAFSREGKHGRCCGLECIAG